MSPKSKLDIFGILFIIFVQFSCSFGVRHGRNLIWSMSPNIGFGVPRIVGIEGDPNEWVHSGNVTVRHISAPHPGWSFRGLAYLYDTQTLFWSESSNRRIQGLQLDGTTSTRTLLTGTSRRIDGIVVDWISLNLYMVDPKYNWIMMVALNSSQPKPLYKMIVRTGIDQPHGIAVYPKKGILVWSDWGAIPKIEKSDLLGQKRSVLVSTNLMHPRGIAIDYNQNLLYWVDSKKNTIESVDFNGNDRRILVSQSGAMFYGIAIFEDYLFVTEQTEGHLRIYDKNTGNGHINYQLGYIPFGIIMYDNTTQEGDASDCQNAGCEQICVKMPSASPLCMCGDGYQLHRDQKSCIEKQEFINPSHIYAIRDAICQYPANLGDMSLKNITLDRQCFLKKASGFLSLTFDSDENMLYYSENVTKSIKRVQLKKGSFTETLIKGIGEVKGMAFDWVTKNLYWTDQTYKWIKVSSSDGRYQRTLVDSNLVEPLGIVVHPQRSQLFWSDPGRSVIEVSALNGGGRKSLPITLIDHPNHLFLDYNKNTLYWTDSGIHQVNSYNLDTAKVEVIYRKQASNFYGISVFQDFLIWTDQGDMNGIHIADIVTKRKMRGLLHPRTGVAHDVITFDKHAQPQLPSVCQKSPCEQLCLGISNASYVCACGTGYQLDDQLKNCVSRTVKDQFLLVADGYQKHLYQVDMGIWEVNALSLQTELLRPIAIGYDPVQQRVMWTDNKLKTIGSVHIDSGDMDIIAHFGEESVMDGLAVDHINRLLFFTDTGLNAIKTISLDKTKYQKTIVSGNLDEPRAIAVHPLQRKIFWSDWGKDPKIECAKMDGTGRMVIVNLTERAWPNGLTIDYKAEVLYWTDGRQNIIESVNLDGTNRRTVLQQDTAHYFGITTSGNYLYVTDWSSRYLLRIPKDGGRIQTVGEPNFSRVNGIVAYDMTETLRGESVCSYTKCQHICLPISSSKFKCVCADGYEMVEKNCMKIGDNSTDDLPDSDGNINLPPETGHLKSNKKPSGLSTAGIVALAVVTSILLLIGGVVGMLIFKRWRARFIPHGRLVEDKHVEDFYRISFPEDKETVSFDSGIENPSYDHIHSKR
ncbi:hypothetical protein FSP39_015919 [Pinctada imbricata]|uniref:EGF-like domain-containing protein n=1 Tax=Pinctada imbricata TaxID=66713 RepID=A0AA89C1M5_PINIB|nr:hypothetical protein FSP39_015919 [Pinctada imbricata]